MKRFSHGKKNGDDTSWMTSYSDVVTSLLAFFVLIVAVSTIDQRKIEYIQEAFKEEILKEEFEKPFSTLEERIREIIVKRNLENDVFIEADPIGIEITFSSSILYKSGSAKIMNDIKPFLRDVARLIVDMNYKNLLIEVEGHTDDLPIRTLQYPSNWELSASRATHVVRFFIRYGIKGKSLKASGYADSNVSALNASSSIKTRPAVRHHKLHVMTSSREPLNEIAPLSICKSLRPKSNSSNLRTDSSPIAQLIVIFISPL